MKRKATIVATGVVAFFVLAMCILPYLVSVDRLRPVLESYLESTLGRKVQIGDLSVSLWSGGMKAGNVSVADDPDFSDQPFVRTKALRVGVSLWSLLLGHKLHVSSLTLENPEITFLRSSSGQWNFSSMGSGSETDEPVTSDVAATASSLAPDSVNISDATVVVGDMASAGGRSVYQHLNLEAKSKNSGKLMTFVLRGQSNDGGKIEIAGQAGPLASGNIAQTSFHGTVNIERLQLAEAATAARSGLNGIVNLRGTVTSDGNVLRSEGSGRAERLLVARGGRASRQPVSFRYQTEYFVSRKAGFIRSAEISTGHSHALLAGSYSMRGQSTVVHLKLTGRQLPVNDVRGILPAFAVTLPAGSVLQGGTIDVRLALDGPLNRLVTSGSVEMRQAHLAHFNLGKRISSIPLLAKAIRGGEDLFIVQLSSRFRIAPDGIQVSTFKSQLSGIGDVSGQGTIDAANHLDFHLTASMAEGGMFTKIISHIPGLKRMPHQVALLVRGTTAEPMFAPDPGFLADAITGKVKDKVHQSLKDEANHALKEVAGIDQVSAPCSQPGAKQDGKVEKPDAGKRHSIFARTLGHIPGFGRKHKKQDKNDGAKTMVAAKY